MLINIKNKEDLITLDLTLKQIRYLKNRVMLDFIPLNNDDIAGYKYLFDNDLNTFKKTIIHELHDFLRLNININDLEILKNE